MSNDHVMSDVNVSDDLRGLTQQLLKTSITERASIHKPQRVYIPPGTSDEDELLLLAGVDPNQWNTTPATTAAEKKLFEMEVAVREQYGYYLHYEDDELTDAALPTNKEELKALGQMISNALLVRHQLGMKKLVFSPIKHPDFPCWLPEHSVNKYIWQAHSVMIASTYPEPMGTRQRNPDAMDMS
jgi:hypothetical protein